MAEASRQLDARREAGLMPLVVQGLGFAAGRKQILSDVSFTLSDSACTVILGPNGAGKSVLMRLLHGLLAPTAGSIEWGGLSPARARRRQGMVFQRPVMLRRSALGNLKHTLAVRKVARGDRRQLAANALAMAGLEAHARQSARTLSGGEQQRLAIARAWMLAPELLLLDEPTSNLDPAATAAIERLIEEVKAQGTRIIMTTHDIGQARRLANEVLFLHEGRLLEHSPAAAFFAGPATTAAARFIRGELPT
ncbi:MAG: phosphate ABC transporter ATP-binding protein [Gammaproteobacteria bacterium]|jgi:tungstate transport system ATP-binding protein